MGRELGVLQGAEDADGVSSGLSLGRERAEKSAGKAVGGGVCRTCPRVSSVLGH